jgi:NAD(P)-dependent dehydrogenase (short-subunit alcohol dehydrogenase family)
MTDTTAGQTPANPTPIDIDKLAPSSLFSLAGKTVLVTGASSGMGHTLAFTAAQAGAKVIAVARRLERLEAMAGRHPSIIPMACDVSDEASRQALAKKALGLGRVDVLVNTAGAVAGVTSAAEDETDADMRYTMEVNLVAPFKFCQAFAPGMREAGGGSIINIASISGVVGIGRLPQASYSASKGGLIGVTREMAMQWARWNIRVNAIAAGYFHSEITAPMWDYPKLAGWVRDHQPLKFDGMPFDFAGTMLLLASPAGRFITGQTFNIDGGWTAQ